MTCNVIDCFSWCPPELLNAMTSWLSSKCLFYHSTWPILCYFCTVAHKFHRARAFSQQLHEWYKEEKEKRMTAHIERTNECTQVKRGTSDPVGRVWIPMLHGHRIRSITFCRIPIIYTVFLSYPLTRLRTAAMTDFDPAKDVFRWLLNQYMRSIPRPVSFLLKELVRWFKTL